MSPRDGNTFRHPSLWYRRPRGRSVVLPWLWYFISSVLYVKYVLVPRETIRYKWMTMEVIQLRLCARYLMQVPKVQLNGV